MNEKQIDQLATEMAKHLPCTVASIADALRKATASVEAPATRE